MYKLSKTNIFFSRFEGTRGEKNQIFRTLEVVKLIFNKIAFTGPNEASVRCANVRRNSHSGYDEVGILRRNQGCFLSKL